MGPLPAALVVALAGVAPAGPVIVNTVKSDVPEPGLFAADTRYAITFQGNAFGDPSYAPTTPAGERWAVGFDPIDSLTDASFAPSVTWEPRGVLLHVATVEPVGPFSGNPNISPRPAEERPSAGEPLEPLWLVVFGSLVVGGIVALHRRMSARTQREVQPTADRTSSEIVPLSVASSSANARHITRPSNTRWSNATCTGNSPAGVTFP